MVPSGCCKGPVAAAVAEADGARLAWTPDCPDVVDPTPGGAASPGVAAQLYDQSGRDERCEAASRVVHPVDPY